MTNQNSVKTELVRARVDEDTKRQAEAVLDSIGLSMSEAIRLFTKQIAVRNEFPIELKVPNSLTRKALQESENIEQLEKVNDLDALFD
jgi:DNA-damage-inducible protein J